MVLFAVGKCTVSEKAQSKAEAQACDGDGDAVDDIESGDDG